MDIKCSKCKGSILKSYGTTVKLRSRHVRWDSLKDTAVAQCNICRSFNELPLSLRVNDSNVILEISSDIKKSTPKEKLIVTTEAKNSEKKQN